MSPLEMGEEGLGHTLNLLEKLYLSSSVHAMSSPRTTFCRPLDGGQLRVGQLLHCGLSRSRNPKVNLDLINISTQALLRTGARAHIPNHPIKPSRRGCTLVYLEMSTVYVQERYVQSC